MAGAGAAMPPFKLERYFAQYEFAMADGLLSCSDPESLTLRELLDLGSDAERAAFETLSLGYTESAGHPQLRAEIASAYAGLRAEDVLVCQPCEGIFLAAMALLRPGDRVVVTFPCYQSLAEVARFRGCTVAEWRLREAKRAGEWEWEADMDELERLLTPRTRMLVVNFPHNPTGKLITAAEQRRIIELCRARDVILFSDEMYRWLELSPSRPRLPAACELYERAVSLGGVSKSLGCPGLRIGWLATRDALLLRAAAEFKDYTSLCASAPSEALALIAVRNREAIAARHVATVRANLELLSAAMQRFPQLRGPLPDAGTVCFLALDLGNPDVEAECRELVKRGLMLAPSTVFDLQGRVRIGLGRKNFPTVFGKLTAVLEERQRAGAA